MESVRQNKKQISGWIWLLIALILVAIIALASWHYLKKDMANSQTNTVKPLQGAYTII